MIRASSNPTLRDIARVLGVSSTTVSLALRNNPRISEETRERVREVADEVGYRPNADLSRVMLRLKSHSHHDCRPVVALVTRGDQASGGGKEPMGCFQGIAETAGYAMDTIYMGDPTMRYARLGEILRARGIRGAVLYRVGGKASADSGWLEGLALCCVGEEPRGSSIPSFEWADTMPDTGSDAPLLQAAMDLLDHRLQRNRLSHDGYGMRVRLERCC